jgi:flagellar export protein FliJ
VTGWRLAPLRRVREHEARAASLALAEALEAEARASLEVARRLLAAEAAARGLDAPARSQPVEAARLAGAAACAGRHAEALLEARAVALRAAGVAEARRGALLAARAGARALGALEARWREARLRARQRAEEAALDELGRTVPRAPPAPGAWRGRGG